MTRREEHGHGNRVGKHSRETDPPTVRKVPADSVPFGDYISINGETVWVAYDARGTRIAVAATAEEVRRKYRERKRIGVKNVAERF
jgi:YD repeat-containing protein